MYLLRDLGIVVDHTSTGLSLVCMECLWCEQLAPKTPVQGAKRIARNHVRSAHATV